MPSRIEPAVRGRGRSKYKHDSPAEKRRARRIQQRGGGGGLKTEIRDSIRTLISLLIDDDSLVSPAGKVLDLCLVHVADGKTLNADQLTARLG